MDLIGALSGVAGAGGEQEGTWDISTAVYNGTPVNFLYVRSYENEPYGLFLKPDGTKLFVIGSSSDTVREFSLSTAWDLGSASYVQGFSVNAQGGNPEGVFFKPDGTEMYIAEAGQSEINQYSLSTAWDISTASYVRTLDVSTNSPTVRDVFFKSDGTKMYTCTDFPSIKVVEYSLSTAWDISSASYVQNFTSVELSSAQGVVFKTDGTKMFVAETNQISEFALSSAWDISTASYTQAYNTLSSASPGSLYINSDGNKLFWSSASDRSVRYVPISSSWDISSAASFTYPATNYFSVATEDTTPHGVFFKPDGTKMYMLGDAGDDINEYSLSTAWNISTASYVQNFSVGAKASAPRDLFFKEDGTKVYVIGSSSDSVHEYSLSSAWDISTASFSQSFSIATQTGSPTGLFFKSDGTKMYVIGNFGLVNDGVYEYDLSTAWDISTASYLQNFSATAQVTQPSSLFFKPDGTKMFIVDETPDDVNEYDLSVAWDVSTSSYIQNFSVTFFETNPTGIFFKPDGKKMFIIGSQDDSVLSYDLT